VKKVQDFTRLVRELPLSRAAFISLVKTIKEDTDVYKLKQRAQIFADRRNNQEMGKLQKNFYDTLKKLNIDQTDIADLIRRFDGGEDVGVLTKKAYDLERKKKIENVSGERTFLKKCVDAFRIESTQQRSYND